MKPQYTLIPAGKYIVYTHIDSGIDYALLATDILDQTGKTKTTFYSLEHRGSKAYVLESDPVQFYSHEMEPVITGP